MLFDQAKLRAECHLLRADTLDLFLDLVALFAQLLDLAGDTVAACEKQVALAIHQLFCVGVLFSRSHQFFWKPDSIDFVALRLQTAVTGHQLEQLPLNEN